MIMAHWLLQTNPRDERAAEILAGGHAPATWALRRYRDSPHLQHLSFS